MPEHIRALIVILSIVIVVFFYEKKAIAPLLPPNEFSRWRNAWFAITLFAFLSQDFWVFIVFSAAYLLYITKSEQNKFALYFTLLLAIPSFSARIPMLFDISYKRLLALIILLPFFISFKGSPGVPRFGRPLAEKLFLAFIVLNAFLLLRLFTFTDSLRYALYSFLEIFLPFYVASRAIKDFDQLKKVMIALVMACMVVGAIAIFEYTRSWLLYNSLQNALNVEWDMGGYLGRADSLRAVASFDHSIILGLVMAVGLGFYLFLAQSITSSTLRLIGFGLLMGGLFASLSRGPWVGAAVLFLVFIAFGKKIVRRLALVAIAVIFALPILNMIPGGDKIIDLIPFVGEVDKENIEYREKLIDRSILIVQRNPFFGVADPRTEPEMADMVQGQGIVDIVNSYLGIALGSGLIGLSLFLGFFTLVLLGLIKKMKSMPDKNSEEYLCGRSLLATMIAVLVIIFTVSGIGIIPTVYWLLAGLIFSYIRIANRTAITQIDKSSTERPVYPTSRLKSHA